MSLSAAVRSKTTSKQHLVKGASTPLKFILRMFSTLSTIIVIFLHLASARNDSLSKTYQFSNQNLVFADTSFDNKTLFYALFAQSSKQCSVIQEINPFTNFTITKKCNFAINADGVQLIVAFGTEKAILITQESSSKSLKLKATTVHMDGCKTVDAELVDVPSDWAKRKLYRDYIDVVVTEQGFEVVIKGLSHLCTKPDAKIYCGLSFDADGNKIEGPVIWPKMAYNEIDIVSPVMADASGQGYFFVNRDSSLMAFQMNRKGGPKFVKLWYTPEEHTKLWRESYSVANKVDGMCYNVNSTIGCWQTDHEGELKINIEFEFDHKFKANIRQCNTTLPTKIQEGITQTTKMPDTTTEITTTQATTVEDTTAPETTVTEEATTQETTVSDVTTESATMTQEITEQSVTQETTEESIAQETREGTIAQETTEEVVMEPITVEGIPEEEITTQNTEMQSSTVPDDTINEIITTEAKVQSSASSQDNTTDSNLIQETTEEDITISSNGTEENATETDASENNTTQDSGVEEAAVTIDGVSLDNSTEDNAVQDITVQGLTTEALTTQDTVTEENTVAPTTQGTETQESTATESIIAETTTHDGTSQDITVQGITEQDVTTKKILIRRSVPKTRSIADGHKIWNLFIHNLRNGGFIILIVTCPNGICSGSEDHYYLMKINAQGKLYGQLEVNVKSKCNAEKNEVFVKVFENDQGQYCTVRLCKSKQPKEEQLEMLVNCYCNSDFK